jgi:hypothetical protein
MIKIDRSGQSIAGSGQNISLKGCIQEQVLRLFADAEGNTGDERTFF